MDVSAKVKQPHVTIGVQVIRANGEIDDLGIVSDSKAGWFRRWRVSRRIRRINARRGLS